MPEEKNSLDWAKKIENWGENFWEKSIIKETVTKRKKSSEYIAAIIVNVVLILVFNNLLKWHIPWLTSEFFIPLAVFNVSFAAIIVLNLLYLAYDARWFRALGNLFVDLISLAAVTSLLQVFPFSFSSNYEYWGRIILVAALVGTFIAILVELIKLIVYIIQFFIPKK